MTFSNNLDPDQARQNAESDRSLQCLQDSDIIIIIIIIIIITIIIIHFSEQCLNPKFCYVFLA